MPSGENCVCDRLEASRFNPRFQVIKRVGRQRDVCFLGRPEIRLDPKMELKCADREPTPDSRRKVSRLGDFVQPQHLAEETARHGLFADGHGDLHMIDCQRHRHTSPISGASSAFIPTT